MSEGDGTNDGTHLGAYDWIADDNEPVHLWFGLSYANYLVMERSLLQSMPIDWQRRFVKCVAEFSEAFFEVERADEFLVQARRFDGKFMKDPVPHYNRGRTHIEPKVRG